LPRKGAALLAPSVPSRERVLSDPELVAVWWGAGRLRPKPRAFVRLLLMTACREMEAADLSAGELELAAGLWRLPASRTKNGRAHSMPLHPLLLSDLRAIWPSHDPAPGYRLLGAIRGGGLRGFSAVKERLDRASEVTGWRFHDLRRTARTAMTRIGVEREAAEAALNHVSHRSALERVYDRADPTSQAIAALNCWQAHLAALVEQKSDADAISLVVSI
jgi:integrase